MREIFNRQSLEQAILEWRNPILTTEMRQAYIWLLRQTKNLTQSVVFDSGSMRPGTLAESLYKATHAAPSVFYHGCEVPTGRFNMMGFKNPIPNIQKGFGVAIKITKPVRNQKGNLIRPAKTLHIAELNMEQIRAIKLPAPQKVAIPA
jgi:hypothetical protein